MVFLDKRFFYVRHKVNIQVTYGIQLHFYFGIWHEIFSDTENVAGVIISTSLNLPFFINEVTCLVQATVIQMDRTKGQCGYCVLYLIHNIWWTVCFIP